MPNSPDDAYEKLEEIKHKSWAHLIPAIENLQHLCEGNTLVMFFVSRMMVGYLAAYMELPADKLPQLYNLITDSYEHVIKTLREMEKEEQ